jgi:hypothetical protein
MFGAGSRPLHTPIPLPLTLWIAPTTAWPVDNLPPSAPLLEPAFSPYSRKYPTRFSSHSFFPFLFTSASVEDLLFIQLLFRPV